MYYNLSIRQPKTTRCTIDFVQPQSFADPFSLSCYTYTSIGFQRSILDYPWIQCALNMVVLHPIINQICSVFADHNLFCHSFTNLIQSPLLCTYKIINITVSPFAEICLPPIIPAKVHAPILTVIAWIGVVLCLREQMLSQQPFGTPNCQVSTSPIALQLE